MKTTEAILRRHQDVANGGKWGVDKNGVNVEEPAFATECVADPGVWASALLLVDRGLHAHTARLLRAAQLVNGAAERKAQHGDYQLLCGEEQGAENGRGEWGRGVR
jgi:hypothetical protein